jgi:hypothetical protein
LTSAIRRASRSGWIVSAAPAARRDRQDVALEVAGERASIGEQFVKTAPAEHVGPRVHHVSRDLLG